ncbi:S41 family peptidase [Croceivirga sp. JEA036]|uniref:S41 family peptidase n=1 Tax=Croceivirga sp. JEA036 TaxID=2721162 RepID=UPI00143A1E7B|nr:S41 family peptidase [Croceivirga sp. JEA036]NJB35285.1 hypothetical protein [Croceivirga sp. JEA036]
MKRKIIVFLFLVLFITKTTNAQDSLSVVDQLSVTAKIWGFLKYYHPEVANGKFDWDSELFTILPIVKSSKNKDELSLTFLNWIERLGPIKPCKTCNKEKGINSFDKNFNLNWITDSKLFNDELSKKLKYIEENRHQGNKHYIAYYKGKPKIAFFQNELSYPSFDWSNENMRLLTLFRYWNMIEYFFPAKYQIDQNWDDVLKKFIPIFLNPNSKYEYHKTLIALVVSLEDSHALIYPNTEFCNFGCYNVPFEFKVVNDSAIITKFYDQKLAELDDLRIGDIITKVDGRNTFEIFQENKKYIHGSNYARKKINSGYYLLNGSTQSVTIELFRNERTFLKTIKRYPFEAFDYTLNRQLEKYRLIGDSIGYINIGKIKTKEVPKVMDELSKTKAIIFDLRNSKSSTPYFFTNYITSEKKTFYKSIYPNLDYPGKFLWSEGGKSGNDKLVYKGKVVLLVDEYCQSQMEFTAMCLQVGDNVTTIGRQTSGSNGNVMKFNMVGGYETQISGIGIFYPNGTETQRKGVKIDINVKPTIQGIIKGEDEILDRAIEFINN